MYCPICGKTIDPEDKRCDACGIKFGISISEFKSDSAGISELKDVDFSDFSREKTEGMKQAQEPEDSQSKDEHSQSLWWTPILVLFLLMVVLISILDDSFDMAATLTIMVVLFVFALVIFMAYYLTKNNGSKVEKGQEATGVYVDSMTGEQFERYIAQRIKTNGYSSVRLTPASGDYGVDIVAIDPNGNRCAIQCKRYSQNVGVKAVQEVYAGAIHYGCTRKIVITSSYFTANAIKLANESGVELIDRRGLNAKF